MSPPPRHLRKRKKPAPAAKGPPIRYTRKTPDPTGWRVDFVTGATGIGQFPPETLPEIAFAGRSNVGKSSLLGALTGNKKAFRISKTPGCTRQINFFRIEDQWHFVDLPGYGFARISRQERAAWDRGLGDYFSQRGILRGVAVLMDVRRGMTDLDRDLIAYLFGHGIPWLPVVTKIDKVRGNERQTGIAACQPTGDAAALAMGPAIPCSAVTGAGIFKLQQTISTLMASPAGTGREGLPQPSQTNPQEPQP